MGRSWICLPLCLLLHDQRPMRGEASGPDPYVPPSLSQAEKRRLELCLDVSASVAALATAPFPGQLLAMTPALPGSSEPSWHGVQQLSKHLLDPKIRISRDLLAAIAMVPQGLNSSLPLFYALDQSEALEEVLTKDPAKFLQMCQDHYQRNVTGYTCKFYKRERIRGKLKVLEAIDVHFKEKPFSVHFHWLEGAGLASKVLYAAGENDNRLLVRIGLFIIPKDVDSSDAKNTSRYTMNQFGMNIGMERTLDGCLKAKALNNLHIKYQGVHKIIQVGNRRCHVFHRAPISPPEEGDDMLTELTIYIDVENWLQIGSILRNAQGDLIAEYFFRDVKLNPTFGPDQFKKKSI